MVNRCGIQVVLLFFQQCPVFFHIIQQNGRHSYIAVIGNFLCCIMYKLFTAVNPSQMDFFIFRHSIPGGFFKQPLYFCPAHPLLLQLFYGFLYNFQGGPVILSLLLPHICAASSDTVSKPFCTQQFICLFHGISGHMKFLGQNSFRF